MMPSPARKKIKLKKKTKNLNVELQKPILDVQMISIEWYKRKEVDGACWRLFVPSDSVCVGFV